MRHRDAQRPDLPELAKGVFPAVFRVFRVFLQNQMGFTVVFDKREKAENQMGFTVVFCVKCEFRTDY